MSLRPRFGLALVESPVGLVTRLLSRLLSVTLNAAHRSISALQKLVVVTTACSRHRLVVKENARAVNGLRASEGRERGRPHTSGARRAIAVRGRALVAHLVRLHAERPADRIVSEALARGTSILCSHLDHCGRSLVMSTRGGRPRVFPTSAPSSLSFS